MNSQTSNDEDVAGRPSDESLLRRIHGGEQEAATHVYLRYSRRLLNLAQSSTGHDLRPRFDAEDVVQSVFRTFFRRASSGCYDVPAGGELWKLLVVLALNKVRRLAIHHRAQKRNVRRTVSSDDADTLLKSRDEDNSESVRILEMVIASILDEMTPSGRRIVQLRIEGHTINEIAKKTERAKRTVERIVRGFRDRLAELIDEDAR